MVLQGNEVVMPELGHERAVEGIRPVVHVKWAVGDQVVVGLVALVNRR